ncbi:hypothetical protein [Desulfobacula sp.]|uniref:hypothetical protein n=1 Tax=Desulfobacula sp. TaxID=2593537 RepID=UPI0025BA9A7F|nr:hypothetical protein [Desulfobacula sp.]MBC2705722.1 hypothetical protein [Desulfobacula sp.]
MSFTHRFNFFYSIFHIIAGFAFIGTESWFMITKNDSSAIIGGVGFWMAVSGVLGIKRSWWGVLCHILVLFLFTAFAVIHAITLIKYSLGSTFNFIVSKPISILIIVWAIAEWGYFVCRIIEVNRKSNY